MKLGSKPDAFQTDDANNVRFVASELATDITVTVDEVKFYLHKFPLLSKSNRLQRLVFGASEDGTNEVYIHDFPGGPKAFEICAKFCYGMTVTLNAYNVAAARCAAEYLEMIEDIEKGNLIYKIDVFLNSSVFCSWKDSIIVLQTTMSLLPWSEELKIVGRCIDSIASKTLLDPSLVNWSYTYNKRAATSDQIVEHYQENAHVVPKDWWVEDISELDIDLYKKVMVAIKSKGRMSSDMIGEALKAYSVRWLPDSYDTLDSDDYTRHRTLVETLVWLLPSDKSSSSCRFLLKLLNFVILVKAGDLLKEDLMNRISSQLHKASVRDLLIPDKANGDTIYDVDLVHSLVRRFMQHGGVCCHGYHKSENMMGDFILGHASLLSLGKLVDGYLTEISRDPNLPLGSFIDLSALVPETARPVHDGLYTAIDIYIKEHPNLLKNEKRRICSLINVKKLSSDASIHAAQNERLPLRVVVQVLFFEQLKAAAAARANELVQGTPQSLANIEKDLERPGGENYKSIKRQLKIVKIEENNVTKSSKNRGGGGLLLPSRSRRIFDKLWVGKGQGENNMCSETSGSSQSPPTSSLNPMGASKSSGSSSRNRRHSIS